MESEFIRTIHSTPMFTHTYVFTELMTLLPRHTFDTIVARYQGSRYQKSFSCRDQFLAMAFGQLAYRESLRDVVACLEAHETKLYHLGFRHTIAKTTLASANEKRDWRIYRDLAEALIKEAQQLYRHEPALAPDIEGACYAIDASVIELCLSLFPWAPHVYTKAAVKLHMMMDIRGSIPTFFNITNARVHDVHFLDEIVYESGAFYLLDRGYVDFERLYALHLTGAFFVTRAKRGMRFRRRYSNPVRKTEGILCDQIIILTGTHTAHTYPDTLRRVKYFDRDTGNMYVFLTNNMTVSAASIALLYKNRWQVELFFKWVKQHLKIKSFWGRSENAVKTQICIALCTYLLVAIAKKRLGLRQNIYEILQILSVSLFDKCGLLPLFSERSVPTVRGEDENTAQLFEF